MKNYFFLSMLLIPFLGYSQWTKTTVRSQKVKPSQEKLEYAALYSLDAAQLKLTLKNAPERFSGSKGVIISLPTAGGKIEKFSGLGIFQYGSGPSGKIPGHQIICRHRSQ
ncbi:hypothetical protein [Chryseobacterium carnipullorum]|uniref:hypothetical protein n=1 Tax=Chryseobacterium carnipullorum TaxID=1124835 RepID=UPI000FE1B4EF|nr:hypothetical protein [Chryseobacterium carnipullorum]